MDVKQYNDELDRNWAELEACVGEAFGPMFLEGYTPAKDDIHDVWATIDAAMDDFRWKLARARRGLSQ